MALNIDNSQIHIFEDRIGFDCWERIRINIDYIAGRVKKGDVIFDSELLNNILSIASYITPFMADMRTLLKP